MPALFAFVTILKADERTERLSPARLGRSLVRHRLELLVLLATLVFVVAMGVAGLVLVR